MRGYDGPNALEVARAAYEVADLARHGAPAHDRAPRDRPVLRSARARRAAHRRLGRPDAAPLHRGHLRAVRIRPRDPLPHRGRPRDPGERVRPARGRTGTRRSSASTRRPTLRPSTTCRSRRRWSAAARRRSSTTPRAIRAPTRRWSRPGAVARLRRGADRPGRAGDRLHPRRLPPPEPQRRRHRPRRAVGVRRGLRLRARAHDPARSDPPASASASASSCAAPTILIHDLGESEVELERAETQGRPHDDRAAGRRRAHPLAADRRARSRSWSCSSRARRTSRSPSASS